ncbi:hypothetical protein WL99_11960 [Burkholderia cepacia]|uniref:hypothetical protein n=1 Tax=Burkholderia cepacia TaxID=292 RepID=UPI0007557F96|nr:hypothetical protein [Burkholderia cepacia]KVQ18860.1 hypothetical protein WK01_34980 [Burkholderia cepacia]KVW15605.1 hypothetical protein WK91_17380 [Burkholderia cepacia]KVZ97241.1 hypothetical protein WL26_37320 [Burkholderia cepacia]KWH32257.1 hypothetical protein WL99_11960 [Burkholderia cepacia]
MKCEDPTLQMKLSLADCSTLMDGLEALLRDRSVAYRISTDVSALSMREGPSVFDFGIHDILRLKRFLENSAINVSMED